MQEGKSFRRGFKIKVLEAENKGFRFLHDHNLTEDDLKKAALELGETEQLRITSLQKLRLKLEDHKNPLHRIDDAYLLRYLRFTKFKIDLAVKYLDKINNLKKDNPDLFSPSNSIHKFLESGFLRVLPYRNQESSLIYWIRFGKWNVEEMSAHNLFQLTSAIMELITMNPSAQVHSTCGIWDVGGFSTQHFLSLAPLGKLMLLKSILMGCYPNRIKQIFLLNCGTYVQKAYQGIRYLIKKKIDERIMILGSDPSELHKYFDRAVLPKEYGGTVEESDCSCTKFVMDNLGYLEYLVSLART